MRKTKGMLYLAVTADRYELPVAVAGSVAELAEMMGASPKVISVAASRESCGRKRGYKVFKIYADEKKGEADSDVV